MNLDARPLGAGDRAPDFELAAGDRDDTIRLAEYRARNPVLLAVMRGLYCPFCRRHLTQLGDLTEPLRNVGVTVLSVVVAPVERARLYFRFRPPRLPVAVDPTRATHSAYGLPQVERTPEVLHATELAALELAKELDIRTTPNATLAQLVEEVNFDGFVSAASDVTEKRASLQMTGHFLVDREGIIRWATVEEPTSLALPSQAELLKLPELVDG
jgi:peroxiredoxin